MNCPPCTGNCDQGRSCPADFPKTTLALRCYIVACIVVLVGWVGAAFWLVLQAAP